MPCERSQDLDLSAFLAAPRDEEFAEFRDHYPRCAECAAEVRAWTELHEALAAAHPDPDRLARYEALAPAERASLDRHVAGCPSCREELAQLASFDPAPLTAPPATPEPRRSWLAGLGRIVWSPAFAYGVAVLLIIPLVQRLPSQDVQAPVAEQAFSESVAVVAEMERRASADADVRLEDAKKDEVAKRGVDPLKAPSANVPAPVPAAAPARKRPAPQAPREVAEQVLADEAVTADDLAKQEASEPAPMARDSRLGGKSSSRQEGAANAFAAGAVRAAAVAPMDALAPSDVVRLESYRTARVPVPDSPLRISVPLPPEMEPGEAWLRVVSADGRRELRERVEVPARGRVEISVPSDWLIAGAYRVEFEGASYAFEVIQASSPRSSSRAAP
jgi:hypothetical protein